MLLVSPTYEGACADVASAARACHAAGVPLVVDEAHGAHLSFLGPDENGTYDTPRGTVIVCVLIWRLSSIRLHV